MKVKDIVVENKLKFTSYGMTLLENSDSIDEVEEIEVSKSKHQGYAGPRDIEILAPGFDLKNVLELGNFSIWRGSKHGNSIYYIVDNRTKQAQIQLTARERKNVLSNLNLFAAPGNTVKAADFYRLLITKLDKVLVGDRQSPGSQAVWAKLNKFPDVDIHGWLRGKPVNIDTSDREYAYATRKQAFGHNWHDNGSPEFTNAFDMKLVAHKKDALEEDWRHWVAGLGAASALAGGGGAAYDAYQASQPAQEPTAQTQQVKGQQAKVKAPVAQQPITQQHVELAKDLLSSAPAKLLTKVAQQAGIKGAELTQFLAQTAHESANFSTTKEFGDKNYFKKYDIKYNPAKAKELGNLRPGEGERYKGRGYIQLTGKYNYQKAGEALGLPLVQHPELAERPDVAARIAVWFWKNRVQPNVSNFHDTPQATKPINPGMKGLQDRDVKFRSMKQALAQPQPKVAQAPAAKPATPVLTKTAAKAPQVKVAAKPMPTKGKVATKPAPVKGKRV